MTPENKRRTPSTHAQLVFNNLRSAVNGGAIVACYRDGAYQIYPNPVVDKDLFEQNVRTYIRHLLDQGIDRKCARNNQRAITDRFYEGTATQQHQISTTLSDAVKGLSRVRSSVT